MSTRGRPEDERLEELLALRAAEGLDAQGEAEAARSGDPDAFDEAAAILGLGMAADLGLEPMPAELRHRLESVAARVMADAAAVRASEDPSAAAHASINPSGPTTLSSPLLAPTPDDLTKPPVLPKSGASGVVGLLGWMAAAACLTLAVVAWRPQPNPTPEQRLAALQTRPGIVRAAWAGLDDAKLADAPHRFDQQLTGEVVWDPATDEGLMVFQGLTPNDPRQLQYQLWIFDADRPVGQLPRFGDGILSQRPVDGGVFDIGAGARVVVPINAKLPVGRAAIFAVTVEPPGGVVVSDRDIVALAVVQ